MDQSEKLQQAIDLLPSLGSMRIQCGRNQYALNKRVAGFYTGFFAKGNLDYNCRYVFFSEKALTALWSAVCVKTQNDAGIYNSCWYLRFMLLFTIHAGIYDPCWYLHFMLVP